MAGVQWDILDDIQYNGESLSKLDRDSIEFPNVEIKATTERALIVLFKDQGITRPVPKSQLAPESTLNNRGDHGTLIVTRWLGRKLASDLEDADPTATKDPNKDDTVKFDGCTCLFETAASILIALPNGAEYRLPKSQLRDSQVEHDGDTGTLIITTWIAKKAGLIT